jgi:cell division protein FtsX
VIGFGLRLAVSGGREAVTRLIVIAAAVAIGAGLLLATIAGVNGVNKQLTRYASMYPTVTAGSADPLWWDTREDYYHGRQILRIDVAATGPTSPTPTGIPETPAPGEYYASPAMQRLLTGDLAQRFPGRNLGTVGDDALTSPDVLLIIVGGTPDAVSKLPQAYQVRAIGDNIPALPQTTVDLILGVVAGGLLFPVLIFIGTATRLSAARREQRFAAMRLVGATPRQIGVVAAVEASAAALLGTVAGFGLFFASRGTLAGIPFTGEPFFVHDLSLSLVEALAVGLGVPAGAALAAMVSLRRVRISPLGVTRRVTPKPPRAYRLLVLAAGLAELAVSLVYRPESGNGQTMLFLPGFLLVLTGLVVAGPWFTMLGARLMARRSGHPAALIAARRLSDNPRAGFRAISGIMLALFITSVATGVMTTISAERGARPVGSLDASTLSIWFNTSQRSVPAAVLDDLRGIGGVRSTTVIRENPRENNDPGVIACTDIPKEYGRCADGAAVAVVPADFIPYRGNASDQAVWPAAPITAAQLAKLPALSIVVDTGGSTAALERARTVLELAYPDFWVGPNVPGDFGSDFANRMRGWQQLADVIVIASLGIAGCSLAVSVVGGLTERRRPFSLLRLSGAPVQVLRRVVGLESAVPMVAVAVVAIITGLVSAEIFLQAQMGYDVKPPGAAYYATVVLGIALCLGIIGATLPLLERITGPETARSE